MRIKILDCTLRDGAHINNGNFGFEQKKTIINSLIRAKIDIIEVGFLDQIQRYNQERTYYNSPQNFRDEIPYDNHSNTQFAFLLRANTCSSKDFPKAEDKEIIRIAFRKSETVEAFKIQKELDQKGYQTYFNPIGVTNYNKLEFEELTSRISYTSAKGFSIVDTYGSLTMNKFDMFLEQINNSGAIDKEIGIHLHENLNKSSALIYRLLHKANSEVSINNFILDGSLMGMGRDPGNIPTELIIQILQEFNISKYAISQISPTILNIIRKEYEKSPWGYNYYYFLTALYGIDRTYGEVMKKHKIDNPLQIINKIIQLKEGNKFNEQLMNTLIHDNFDKKF